MARVGAKKQALSHAIDADGQRLLASKLPRSWQLRPYRPDYGLDYALELFEDFPDSPHAQHSVETLGEHLFIQLKTISKPETRSLTIYGRHNVEKSREAINRRDRLGTLETYRVVVDTPELVTVERMGVAVPVLLIVADLTHERCSFVCLNDYIDKVLVPRNVDYTSTATRTIHIPASNEIGSEQGDVGLRWYGKRAKLFAAFQRFGFQHHELERVRELEWRGLAEYFAQRIACYDIWDGTPMWGVIAYLGASLRRFIETGQPGLISDQMPPGSGEEFLAFLREQDVFEQWRQLANLPRVFEDICREWLLPTGVGFVGSFAFNGLDNMNSQFE